MPAIIYETVQDMFIQDAPSYVPTADQIPARFGLVQDQWPDIHKMNVAALKNEKFKLLFIARHGEGFHNAASKKFGKEIWESHWAYLEGDDELTWGPDPELNDRGIAQAQTMREAWETFQPPMPQTIYSSPLRRALHTCAITFPDRPATVIEDMRELVTGFSCDYRLPKSVVAAAYPQHNFERMEAETDPYAGYKETHSQLAVRVRNVLDRIFREDPSEVVSITAHGDWMKTASEILGRKKYRIPTGGAVAFVVKATLSE